ncbi:amino acid ABC transporter permease [Streptomyces sp. NPDC005805]|uniref:amino acid ABC transporter permease n=1 Tax=Streptomyces sp. NPDC005805 TaxID=3157068 RepID=UPI0033DB6669
MPWDEWDELKASAAERDSAGMQLNGIPEEGRHDRANGGGDGRLKHSAKPWNQAAGTASSLGVSTQNSKGNLSKGHAGMAAGLEGLASLGELKSVLTSWENRLQAVRDECEALEPKLRQVPKDLTGVDSATGSKSDAVQTPKEGAAK